MRSLIGITLSSDPKELIVEILKKEGPKLVKDLQARTKYKSRSQFLAEVIKPLIEANIIQRWKSEVADSSHQNIRMID